MPRLDEPFHRCGWLWESKLTIDTAGQFETPSVRSGVGQHAERAILTSAHQLRFTAQRQMHWIQRVCSWPIDIVLAIAQVAIAGVVKRKTCHRPRYRRVRTIKDGTGGKW